MEFRIADTFTASLARLTGDEQKAVKTTAFDLQVNPAGDGGARFHRLDRGKDRNFWSVRASADLRLIVHRTAGSLLLCYVDHHDKAYAWAERRRLETHPRTGAAQLVEVRETVQELLIPVAVPVAAAAAAPAPAPPPALKLVELPLFAGRSDDELLGYGVPAEWLDVVRAATEASILGLADHLPAEAAEALLELATGGRPAMPAPAPLPAEAAVVAESTVPYGVPADPFDHPDARRRFRVMKNREELEQALDAPWDRWTIFLHPAQRALVERAYAGPARVSGSAGTGKTIVALHRAAHLARTHPDARVLLTTISDALANDLHVRLRRLISHTPHLAERIDVHALDAVGLRLYRAQVGPVTLATAEVIRKLIQTALAEAERSAASQRLSLPFLVAEWEHVVDARQVATWEEYRDVPRLGRKTRLSEAQRAAIWSILDRVRQALGERGLLTQATVFTSLAGAIARSGHRPYDFAVIDEAQDLRFAQLNFLAALGGDRPDALFFAGDLGQRIFQQPFSWRALGVDVRGRARTLRVNYRTSHQIRRQADRLLGPELADVDGTVESRRGTVSVFNGPPPDLRVLGSEGDEAAAVGSWLQARAAAGMSPHEIAVFVRSPAQIDRARVAADRAGLSSVVLDERLESRSGRLSIGTMHLAKGLEFRAVAVMACDDEVIPSQERIEAVGDGADLQEVYDTERHLLYVACTRARDELLVTGVAPASEFLDDLRK